MGTPLDWQAEQIAQAGGAPKSFTGPLLNAGMVQVVSNSGAPTATDDVSSSYYPGYRWLDIATSYIYECTDNTASAAVWVRIYPGDVSMPVLAKTATYPVTAADKAKMINCTSGTFTVTLLAAATAGDGFIIAVRNSGTGLITLTESGTPTITEGVPPGSTIYVTCDGSAYEVISQSPRPPTIHVREEQTSGTVGGSSSTGWQTRVLNTVVENSIPNASLASNQVTLPAGRYRVRHASAPAFRSNAHKLRLYNVTDTLTEAVGQNAYNLSTASYAQTTAVLRDGEFVLAASKTLELQHYTASAQATNGFGLNVSSGEVEVYAELIIEKVG